MARLRCKEAVHVGTCIRQGGHRVLLGGVQFGAQRRSGDAGAFQPFRFVHLFIDRTAQRERDSDQARRGKRPPVRAGQAGEQAAQPAGFAAGCACARGAVSVTASRIKPSSSSCACSETHTRSGASGLGSAPSAGFGVDGVQIVYDARGNADNRGGAPALAALRSPSIQDSR